MTTRAINNMKRASAVRKRMNTVLLMLADEYGGEVSGLIEKALCGSLDAAREVHRLLIPEWDCMIRTGKWVEVWHDDIQSTCNSPVRGEDSDTATAWVLAAVKAEPIATKHAEKQEYRT